MEDQEGFYDPVKFGARLLQARRGKRLNQTDFAALGGVGLGSQSKYEQGATEPSASYFARLAADGIDIVYLLTGQRSAESLDADTTAIVTALERLVPHQRSALLAFLATLNQAESTMVHAPAATFGLEPERMK